MKRLSVSLVIFFFAPLARAGGDPVAAQHLFEEARALMDAKKFDSACPKLEASQKLDPGPGTLLNLGGCYEGLGRTASAWITYKDAESAASKADRKDWTQQAHDHATRVAPLLAYLTIAVPSAIRDRAADAVEIDRDGQSVDRAVWDQAIPIDPGKHRITARAARHAPWSTTIEVAPRARETVTIQLGAGLTEKAPAEQAAPVVTTRRSPLPGILGIGVGGAALVAGGIFGLAANNTYDDAVSQQCSGNIRTCSPAGVTSVHDAEDQATLSTAFVIGGAVLALAGAAYLVFFRGSSTTSTQRTGARLRSGVTF